MKYYVTPVLWTNQNQGHEEATTAVHLPDVNNEMVVCVFQFSRLNGIETTLAIIRENFTYRS